MRWFAVGAAAVGIVLVVVLGSRFGSDPFQSTSPLIGAPAPDVELPYLERSGSFSFDDAGGDIVIFNFWSSWCVPCRAEHGDLVATAEAYDGLGVRFVGVVYQDQPSAVIQFLDELGRGYDIVVDPVSQAAIDFGVIGIPETFFIDRKRVIVAKITGAANALAISTILDAMLRGQQPESRTTGTIQQAPGG